MKILLSLLCFSLSANASIRSQAVIYNFKKLNPCPTDYLVDGKCTAVVDHICSLFNGGIDRQPNLQWQSIVNARSKDKVENTMLGRKIFCNSKNSTPTRQVFNK